MARYHINEEGNAGKCSAQEGNCPFGTDAPHFDTVQEARRNYEQSFNNSFEKPKPVKKAKIYRVGTLEAPEKYFEDLEQLLIAVDEHKPEGRQGRYGGIFASPDMKSHSRWVLGNQWNKHEGALDSHEITVDANSVYVYDVEQYETVSAVERLYGKDSEKFKEEVDKFWNSGMTLSDWQEWAKENKPNAGDWEIIMPPEAMISTKKMSNRTVIENAPENKASEINHLLEPNRATKGLIWRKNNLTDEEKELIKTEAFKIKNLDIDFIKDMETIYSKNAYKSDSIHNPAVLSEVYSSMKRLRKKDGEEIRTLSELSRDEKQDITQKISSYLKIVENVVDER